MKSHYYGPSCTVPNYYLMQAWAMSTFGLQGQIKERKANSSGWVQANPSPTQIGTLASPTISSKYHSDDKHSSKRSSTMYHNSRYEDGEQEHCLEMWDRDGKGLGWNDTPCSFSTFFICEAWRLISNYYHHKTHPIYYQQWLFLKNNYSMCISQAIKQITWWFSFV